MANMKEDEICNIEKMRSWWLEQDVKYLKNRGNIGKMTFLNDNA